MEHQTWVSRYRDELKGFAILWVMLFHSPLALPGALDWVRQLGYGGVDIFLFLMGMGLYRSLQTRDDLRSYVSRRLWRILPSYLPVIIIWMAVMYHGYALTPVQALRGVVGNVTMTGYWLQTPRVFNWFANAQFLYILLAPLCYAALACSRKPLRTLLILLAFMGCVGITGIGLKQMMALSRLPIFVLGMAFAMAWPVSKRKTAVRNAYAIAFLIGVAAVLVCHIRFPFLLNDFGMYWYPFALITPGLCVGLAFLLQKAEKIRGLFTPLRTLGKASFEIYLLNIWMVELLKIWKVQGTFLWLVLCVFNALAGIGYHILVENWSSRLQRKTPKNAGEIQA